MGKRNHHAAERFATAVYANRVGDPVTVRRIVEALASQPEQEVAAAVAGLLEQQIASAWNDGWQPADLHRRAARVLGQGEVRLLSEAIAAQAQGYARLGDRVAPRWMSQLAGIDARRTLDPRMPYLLQLTELWADVLGAAVRVMSLLQGLPVLPQLTDPPSSWREGAGGSDGSLPAGVLEKVRALLAKAEATPFEAEAEAFTAKAQQLMARHRIDRAVLSSSTRGDEAEPVGRRIGVDDPYADAKALLLGGIAQANGCHAVWSRGLGFSTVFGFDDELGAVEELFTSLLVQASSALRREGPKQDWLGRSRTKRFRRSFLVAFAIRISDRLHDAVDAAVRTASAQTGTALVPILAARQDATAAAAQAVFPELGSFAPAASDEEGWHAGTLLGEQADLAVGPGLTTSGGDGASHTDADRPQAPV